ncbi:unnamed protein product, partial [Prunus armeniaca]
GKIAPQATATSLSLEEPTWNAYNIPPKGPKYPHKSRHKQVKFPPKLMPLFVH